MEDSKDYCDVCEKEKESSYSKNLEQYLCEECWDDYGEACHYGLA